MTSAERKEARALRKKRKQECDERMQKRAELREIYDNINNAQPCRARIVRGGSCSPR